MLRVPVEDLQHSQEAGVVIPDDVRVPHLHPYASRMHNRLEAGLIGMLLALREEANEKDRAGSCRAGEDSVAVDCRHHR